MRTISLDGQVAIITGAGQGLGRSYAMELARRGAAVIVNDIVTGAADAVVAEIVAANGRAAPVYDSVATAEGGAAMVKAALDSFGTVDIVVHNAGAWRNAPVDEMTTENLDPVLDVHVRGAFFVVQPAWPIMAAKGYGRIILTSSNVAAFGREQGANYVAAKAALLGLTRALALEGQHCGVVANAIMPNAATSDERRPMNEDYRRRLEVALAPLQERRTPEMVLADGCFPGQPRVQRHRGGVLRRRGSIRPGVRRRDRGLDERTGRAAPRRSHPRAPGRDPGPRPVPRPGVRVRRG